MEPNLAALIPSRVYRNGISGFPRTIASVPIFSFQKITASIFIVSILKTTVMQPGSIHYLCLSEIFLQKFKKWRMEWFFLIREKRLNFASPLILSPESATTFLKQIYPISCFYYGNRNTRFHHKVVKGNYFHNRCETLPRFNYNNKHYITTLSILLHSES